jgi:hypothetical protein
MPVLLFTCNMEKGVVDLFKHLVGVGPSGTRRFECMYFCPISTARPSLAGVTSGREVLVSKAEAEGYALPELLQLHDEVVSGLGEDDEASRSPALAWLCSLRTVWVSLCLYHYRRSGPQVQPGVIAEEAARVWASVRVRASVQEVLAELPTLALAAEGEGVPSSEGGGQEGAARQSGRRVQLLVTGSLYLIGDVLSLCAAS